MVGCARPGLWISGHSWPLHSFTLRSRSDLAPACARDAAAGPKRRTGRARSGRTSARRCCRAPKRDLRSGSSGKWRGLAASNNWARLRRSDPTSGLRLHQRRVRRLMHQDSAYSSGPAPDIRSVASSDEWADQRHSHDGSGTIRISGSSRRLAAQQCYANWFRSKMREVFDGGRRALALEARASVEDIPEHRVRTPLQSARFSPPLCMFSERVDDKPISIILTTLAAGL